MKTINKYNTCVTIWCRGMVCKFSFVPVSQRINAKV
jgi:hypothetical protein